MDWGEWAFGFWAVMFAAGVSFPIVGTVLAGGYWLKEAFVGAEVKQAADAA